jgi:hypothetical protein
MAKTNHTGIGSNSRTRLDALSPEDKEELVAVIGKLEDSFCRQQAEGDLQKTLLSDAVEKLPLPKKLIKKLAKVHYKANFKDEVAEAEDFQSTYEYIFDTK